jgi:DNA replication protein DnaC
MDEQTSSSQAKKLLNEDEQAKCKFNICNGSGWISFIDSEGVERWKPCKCLIDRRKEKILGFFKDVDLFKTEPQNESQRKALETVKVNPYGSYYIFGEIRTGKTHLMAGIYNYVYDNITQKIEWYRDKDLKEFFRECEMGMNDLDVITDIKEKRKVMIFLDDLGKVELNDFVRQEFYEFIDEVYVQKCKMVLTSVFGLEELVNLYGVSVVRRIEDIVDNIIKIKPKE